MLVFVDVIDEMFGRFVVAKMIETFICNTFVRESAMTSVYVQQHEIFGKMMIILNILVDTMFYFVGYYLKFNIIASEYRQIDFSPDKFEVTIRIEMQTKTHIHNNMQHSHNTSKIDIGDIILNIDSLMARIVIQYISDCHYIDTNLYIRKYTWFRVLCFTIYQVSTLGRCN